MNSKSSIDSGLVSLLKRLFTIKHWSGIRRNTLPELFEGFQALVHVLSTENNTK